MSKTIYINENMYKKLLQETTLLDVLPEDIMNTILKNQTSLKDNPAIPKLFDENFLERVSKKYFEEIKNELKKIGSINDFEDNQIESVLSKLINKCQELEKPYRQELEKICINYVIDLFEIPEDSITFQLNLVDAIDNSKNNIPVDPTENADFSYENVDEIEKLSLEISKRRMLNALSMGASIKFSSNIKSYMEYIYDINPKLLDLYRKIIWLNNYLLFTKEDLGISDENKLQFGFVNVGLGLPDENVTIEANALIFPVLLSETIKGLMELFASHGLPKDKEMINQILNKTDYIKAEPWDMRIGPSLWTLLTDSFEDVDTNIIPYLYKKIAKLPVDKFNILLKNVFARTNKGKRMLAILTKKAKEDKEYSKFADKMATLQTDKNIITDDYIHPDEL